jgi:acyl-CoA synthetase (AMP-forming)/AMP-acid ligase II
MVAPSAPASSTGNDGVAQGAETIQGAGSPAGAQTYAATLERFGDRPAVVCESGQTLTYRQLAAEADAFAAQLGPKSQLLAVEARNALEPLVALIGALRRGHVVLLLPGGAGLNNERVLELYAPGARFSETADGWKLELNATPGCALNPDLALLVPTSGSTGAAKLVRLSHSNIAANAAAIADYLGIVPSDAAVTALPMHYCYGLSVIASHLSRGARVLLTDRSVIDPEFWTFARAQGVTNLAGVPYTFDLLERIGLRDEPPATLRTVTQAGGRLTPHLVNVYGQWARRNGVQMFVMYGQTEATARMAYVPPDRLLESPGAIGVPIPGGAITLRAEDGSEIHACDTPGEIVYTGPNVMMGYADGAADLAKGALLKELATGDLARRGRDGLYHIVGRRSRFSKLYGMRVSLDEIEAALAEDGLKTYVAGDDSLVAVAGARLPGGLAQALAARYGLPASCFGVVEIDEPPTLASGKIDYGEILSRAKAAAPAAPADDGTVEDAFRRVFEGRVLKGDDSFSSLGGDSLSYVTLSLDIERALGYLPENWQDITLARYAEMQNPPARRGSGRGWPRLEIDVVLRAVAVLSILTRHAFVFTRPLPIHGGAVAFMMLVGFNLARFQRQRLSRGRGLDLVRSMAVNLILPAYVLSLLYRMYKHDLDAAALLFANNFKGEFRTPLQPYWFLQALFQCALIMAALFSLKWPQAWARTAPWRLGLGLLAAFLALRYAAILIFHHNALANRTPDAVLYLLALGWTLQQTRTLSQRLLLTGVSLGVVGLNMIAPWRWGSFIDVTEALWLGTCCLLILWIPRVALPPVVKGATAAIAAASFYIYLVQEPIIEGLRFHTNVHSAIAGEAAALAAGLLVWRGATLMRKRLAFVSHTLARRHPIRTAVNIPGPPTLFL